MAAVAEQTEVIEQQRASSDLAAQHPLAGLRSFACGRDRIHSKSPNGSVEPMMALQTPRGYCGAKRARGPLADAPGSIMPDSQAWGVSNLQPLILDLI
jgi:hypothetical protein